MREAETGAAQKVFDLDLPELGPYNLAFNRSGRHMLLGGRKGHLAIMEWQQRHLVCEVQVCQPQLSPFCHAVLDERPLGLPPGAAWATMGSYKESCAWGNCLSRVNFTRVFGRVVSWQ